MTAKLMQGNNSPNSVMVFGAIHVGVRSTQTSANGRNTCWYSKELFEPRYWWFFIFSNCSSVSRWLKLLTTRAKSVAPIVNVDEKRRTNSQTIVNIFLEVLFTSKPNLSVGKRTGGTHS
jgi:hypothetical protein